MDLQLAGKRALVTGAGRGLGRVIAVRLAGEGAMVAVVSRTQRDIDSVVADMGGAAKGHHGYIRDLMPDGAAEEIVRTAAAEHGNFDIVVHNVGGTLGIKDPLCPVGDWRKSLRYNLEIAIEINRIVVPSMKTKGWGRLVHISSIAAAGSRGSLTYSTTKAALNQYVKGLGVQLARDGIVASAIMPGAILTEDGTWQKAIKDRPEFVKKYLDEKVATGRFAAADEIAAFVLFLCSEQATLFTGAVLPIDGGTLS